jgi:hypothetical protein
MATIAARRRLIRDGAELKNEPNCRMSPIPQTTGEIRYSAKPEHVLAAGRCRDCRENSNVPVVRRLFGSGFIVRRRPATVKIFSAETSHVPPMILV